MTGRRLLRVWLWGCLGSVLGLGATLGHAQLAPTLARAVTPRSFVFPRDHGAHPAFRVEWWHFAGLLEGTNGQRFGVQATWFRTAEAAALQRLVFHGALTDLTAQQFAFVQEACMAPEPCGVAEETKLAVAVRAHRAQALEGGDVELAFEVQGRPLHLRLHPERAPMLHGQGLGLVPKGAVAGEASHHISVARLAATGEWLTPDGARVELRGHLWFDHEFGSHQLGAALIGWDWFGVTLDDGSDLMLYTFRRADGSRDPKSFGTLVTPEGQQTHLTAEEVQIEAAATWRSPTTGTVYPAGWTVRIPDRALTLQVSPLVPDQELRTLETTGLIYWEGACRVAGARGDQALTGTSYAELVGYPAPVQDRM